MAAQDTKAWSETSFASTAIQLSAYVDTPKKNANTAGSANLDHSEVLGEREPVVIAEYH